MDNDQLKYISNSTGKKMILFGMVINHLKYQLNKFNETESLDVKIESQDIAKVIYDVECEDSVMYNLHLLKELANCTLHVEVYSFIGKMIYDLNENCKIDQHEGILKKLTLDLNYLTKEVLKDINYMQGYNIKNFKSF